MNRKTLLIVIVLLVALALAAMYLFFARRPSTTPAPTETPCLVFQSTDPNGACYVPFVMPTPTSKPQPPSPTASTTAPIPSSAAATACSGAGSIFERDGCIADIAKQTKDPTACDSISTALAQGACRADIVASTTPLVSTGQQSYAQFLNQVFSTQPKASPFAAPTISRPSAGTTYSPAAGTSSALQGQVLYNISFGAPLAVYASSKHQVAPGESVKIFGSGFSSVSNTLNIGQYQSTLSSADGNTLLATAPGTIGSYEIWVTNDKGSSRNAQRPVTLIVTNSPKPLPVIMSASPSPVPVDGTVTLFGKNFGSSNNLLTSLGIIQGISSSDGSSLSFPLSSLPYLSKVKDIAAIKGKIMPVMVNLQTDAGATENIFQFDVQF